MSLSGAAENKTCCPPFSYIPCKYSFIRAYIESISAIYLNVVGMTVQHENVRPDTPTPSQNEGPNFIPSHHFFRWSNTDTGVVGGATLPVVSEMLESTPDFVFM